LFFVGEGAVLVALGGGATEDGGHDWWLWSGWSVNLGGGSDEG
jgi:hypothetical protein